MKKNFLVVAFLVTALSGFGQKGTKTLGVIASPNLKLGDSYASGPKVGGATGIFYDHLVTRRLGLNTGMQLGFEWYKHRPFRDCWGCEGEQFTKGMSRRTLLEVPVNLTFCLNPDSESGVKVFVFSGILLNRLMVIKTKLNYSDEVKVYRDTDHRHDIYGDSYMNLGLEVRKKIGENYTYAFGTNAKFRPAYTFVSDPHLRDPFFISLNLKFGRNL